MSDTTIEMDEPIAETADPVENAISDLKEKFPGEILDDERVRHSGLIVPAEKLIEISEYVHDNLGFNYLSCLTGVDLIDENKMEVVYHTFSTEKGGGPMVLKVQVDRENPEIPSVVPIWPGADFQEREIYDLMGISFEGHPNMKRIFLWDGFPGHPLRKDYL